MRCPTQATRARTYARSRTFTTTQCESIAAVHLNCKKAGGLQSKFVDKNWRHFVVLKFHSRPDEEFAFWTSRSFAQILFAILERFHHWKMWEADSVEDPLMEKLNGSIFSVDILKSGQEAGPRSVGAVETDESTPEMRRIRERDFSGSTTLEYDHDTALNGHSAKKHLVYPENI